MASEDANKPPMPTVESAPDPDEDDLDDLDGTVQKISNGIKS